MKHLNAFTIGMLVVPLALLGLGVAIASSVATPNTFTAGTVAVAAQVNDNFTAHANAINDNDTRITANTVASGVQVWAQKDSDAGGMSEVALGQKEMNSIAIVAPTAGYLVITGSAYINNQSATAQGFAMYPKLDGTDIAVGGWYAYARLDPVGDPSVWTQSFTITTPVTAGAHTVSYTAGPFGGTTNWYHDRENLTVVFYPTGNVTTQASP